MLVNLFIDIDVVIVLFRTHVGYMDVAREFANKMFTTVCRNVVLLCSRITREIILIPDCR